MRAAMAYYGPDGGDDPSRAMPQDILPHQAYLICLDILLPEIGRQHYCCH
jgi:hypothetical protein